MGDWIEPSDWRRWVRRAVSLRPLLVVLLAGVLLVAELRFDWVERVLGSYLVSTNTRRPESGAIWEKGRKAQTARMTLEKIVTDRQAAQREVRHVTSVGELADSLTPGQGVLLSPEQFRQMYLRLPEAVSQRTLPAFELLRLAAGGRWHRTYIERTAGGMEIYLLDAANRVLQQAAIDAVALARLVGGPGLEPSSLDDLPHFRGRIYPAEQFFEVLASFPEDLRQSILPQPERLLSAGGQIRRVGISDETGAGFIELGFEIADGPQVGVMRTRGGEWSVWRLRTLLEARLRQPAADPDKEIGAPL